MYVQFLNSPTSPHCCSSSIRSQWGKLGVAQGWMKSMFMWRKLQCYINGDAKKLKQPEGVRTISEYLQIEITSVTSQVGSWSLTKSFVESLTINLRWCKQTSWYRCTKVPWQWHSQEMIQTLHARYASAPEEEFLTLHSLLQLYYSCQNYQPYCRSSPAWGPKHHGKYGRGLLSVQQMDVKPDV